MGEYELVVFLTDNKIYVMEVDFNSKTKLIGFHGEDFFHYENDVDLDDFYKNITDTYNVDDLSDLNTNVFLIDCGMDSEIKWYLIDKLKSCECLNFNSISCLLPILLSKKGLLQVGKQIVVEFLEEKYTYICDDEYHVEELATRGKNAKEILKMEDFSFIAVWEGSLSQNNTDEIEDKLREATSALNIQKETYENKIIELNRTIESLKNECDSINVQLQTILKKQDEKIAQDIIKNRRIIKAEFSYFGNIIKEEVKNGDIVKVNQRIGGLFKERKNPRIYEEIYAPRDGKVAWLLLDGDEPFGEYADIYHSNWMIVAVVGDESDNVDDMIKWVKDSEKEQLQKKKK